MNRRLTGPLDDAQWRQVQQSVPILCVDVVPVRRAADRLQVGLIRRTFAETPDEVWCHLGGRVRYGETTDEAVQRHLIETLDLVGPFGAEVGLDPQPHHVMQWFPGTLRTAPTYGEDPRKHALSLCFALELGPDLRARAGGEGRELRWFAPADVTGSGLWPGTAHLVAATLAGAGLTQR